MKLNDAMIERAARGICAGRSLDPDDWYKYTSGRLVRTRSGNKVPLWTVYENDARAALESALKLQRTVIAERDPLSPDEAMVIGILALPESWIGKRVALVPVDD